MMVSKCKKQLILFYRQWELACFGVGGRSLKMIVVIPSAEFMKL
jgi:hypothetical protein